MWARWIDGAVQGDREFLKVAGLDPDTGFEDPHAFVELVQALLDEGSATVVLDIPPGPEGAGGPTTLAPRQTALPSSSSSRRLAALSRRSEGQSTRNRPPSARDRGRGDPAELPSDRHGRGSAEEVTGDGGRGRLVGPSVRSSLNWYVRPPLPGPEAGTGRLRRAYPVSSRVRCASAVRRRPAFFA